MGTPGGFFAPPSQEVTLTRMNGEASNLYQQVWQADAEPTSAQMTAERATDQDRDDVMKRWNEFKSTELPAINASLREAKIPEINLQAEIHQDEPSVDEE